MAVAVKVMVWVKAGVVPPSDGPAVKLGAVLNVQLVLLPESVMLREAVVIAVAFTLFESLTSR